jgi:hypothetical protein
MVELSFTRTLRSIAKQPRALIGTKAAQEQRRQGEVLLFDISDFRRSHHVVNVRARSCCFSLDELAGLRVAYLV